MTRYALGVEYDGSEFNGWQRLTKSGTPDDTTVQAALEAALSSVADARVDTICAGAQALKELPQPQVDFTFGLLNLKPEPSIVST